MTKRHLVVMVGISIGAMSATGCENEGRSDEAQRTVVRYLEAIDGAEPDRGWSLLSASMREHSGSRDAYIELAAEAAAPLAIESVVVSYEDDGFYDFTVTTERLIDAPHAALLFDAIGEASAIACSVDERTFRIAVIIGVLAVTEQAGITGNECAPPTHP